jgi:multidrug efflux pump subunit AcrB
MNLVTAALRRPLSVMVGVVAVALLVLQKMPPSIFPSLGVPVLYVAQPCGGMDPVQLEGYLNYYCEYHFRHVPGVEHVESKSIQGVGLMKLQFHRGTDMALVMAETVAQISRARAFMPPGTVPPFVMRFDAGSVPVGNLAFTSDTHTVPEFQDAELNRPLPVSWPNSGQFVSLPPAVVTYS